MGSVSRDADTSNARAPFGDFMSISNLIDRPIAFQRTYVRLGVGIKGALMLSQAVYWHNRTKNDEGWFYKDQREWEEETGLTRREQESARRHLIEAGYLEEERRGVPCRLFYRVKIDNLDAALMDMAQISHSSLHGSAKLDCPEATSKAGTNSQTITETTQEITSETTTKPNGPTLKEREAEAFERFWSAGMRKVDKAQARPAFQRARKRAKLAPEAFSDMLVADVQRRLRLGQTGFDKLHPKTYLNNQRWEDELAPSETTPSSTTPRGLDDGRQRQYQGTDDTDLPDFLREGGEA